MKQKAVFLLLMIMSLLAACCGTDKEKDEGRYQLSIEQITDSFSVVRLFVDDELMDTLSLPYPVYRFDYGDLTGNGIPEVTVGVIKPTKYWKEPAKRLFIYHLYHGRYIRPLWLGSRVGSPLVDFEVCRDSFPAVIHTTEMRADSSTFRAEYRLQGFGLKYKNKINL